MADNPDGTPLDIRGGDEAVPCVGPCGGTGQFDEGPNPCADCNGSGNARGW